MSETGVHLLHPLLAIERAADIQGDCHVTGDLSFAFKVPANLPTPEERAQHVYRCNWWEAHYWGVPDRKRERNLAVVRGIVAGVSDEEGVRLIEKCNV